MKQDVDSKVIARAFKALANPNRLTIYLQILNHHESNTDKTCDGCLIAEVMSDMNIGAPTVSHHVKELVNANLIEVQRQGKFVSCFINDVMHEQLRHFFTPREKLQTG